MLRNYGSNRPRQNHEVQLYKYSHQSGVIEAQEKAENGIHSQHLAFQVATYNMS